jgi:RNA polymerase sigma factor (sigma-70 family)
VPDNNPQVGSESNPGDGERERFEALFRAHYGAVYRYSTRRVGATAAGDVAAEVFLVAWRRRGDLHKADHTRSSARAFTRARTRARESPPKENNPAHTDRETLTWLLGVARRVCANHLRSRGRSSALGERLATERTSNAVSLPPALTSEEHEPGGTIEERLDSALRSLRADDRELLTMVAWDGLENREAARLLGCSPRTFAVRLHRARRRLAGALAAQQEDVSEGHSQTGGVVEHEAC